MTGSKRLVAMSLALLLAVGHGATVAQEGKPGDSPDGGVSQDAPATPTVSARYVVRIAWDDRVPLPEMTHFILSQRETRDSARVCLNLEKPPQFSARVNHERDGTYDLTLSVAVDPGVKDVRLGAAEFLEEIIGALPDQLGGHQSSVVHSEVDQARTRLQRLAIELAERRQDVAGLRAHLRKQTGRADATENWSEAIASLEQERQELTLDAAGQQARRRAIEETIARITKGAEQRAKDDEIAQELAKIVAHREEELHRAKQLVAEGMINATEIANIGAKVAEARAKLLERRELSARAAGGELLHEFNRELMMLTINAAESEARLKLIMETLERLHQSAGDVDRLKLAEEELAAREAAYRTVREQRAAVEDRFRSIRPATVSIVESKYQTLDELTKERAQPR